MEYKDTKERYIFAYSLIENITNFDHKKVLDIGCGVGNMALAASKLGASEIYGVDINLTDFGETHFKKLAKEKKISIDKIKFIEDRVENVKFDGEYFDVITIVDVLEHVDNPEILLKEAYRILKPEGYLLINISPLYYSQIGHHLWPYFPREKFPWIHLWKSNKNNSILKIVNDIDEWSWDHYIGLNKITLSQLKDIIDELGFKVEKFYYKRTGEEIYEKYRNLIDIKNVPNLDDLFIEWIQFILRKVGGGVPEIVEE
jgi:ubiquinone/menaquinone biosynthesis C-methylase UbiE